MPESHGTRKTCFVTMPFGKKTDFQTGRVLDMDTVYWGVIKPAVEQAGLDCIRADEIVHQGLIDLPMYEQLLSADLVIADLSTLNPNVLYELGVRHSLRPFSTLIIAEEQVMRSPVFDLSQLRIRQYRHLGEDIGVSEVKRFRTELATAIQGIMALEPELRRDSPVYKFIPSLQPPLLAGGAAEPGGRLAGGDAATASTVEPNQIVSPLIVQLTTIIAQFEKAVASSAGATAAASIVSAIDVFEEGHEGQFVSPPLEPIMRMVRTALELKANERYEVLLQARQLLEELSPKESTDSELLKLLGELELALYDAGKQLDRLERARQAFQKLYALRPDYDIASALAHVVSLQTGYRRNKIALLYDMVYANYLRREVVELGKSKLSKIDERYSPEGRLSKDADKTAAQQRAEAAKAKLSVLAAIAEAHYALGETDSYTTVMNEVALLPQADAVVKRVKLNVALLDSFVEKQAVLLSSLDHLQAVQLNSPRLADRSANATERVVDEPSSGRPSGRPDSAPDRNFVFFSYSHNPEDEKILEEIKNLLSTAIKDENIILWHDKSGIKPGQDWEEEIKGALSKAKGAVLLVSRKFLNSEFIKSKELPIILEGAKEGKITLLWIAVEKAFFDRTLLYPFEALNDPKQPLSTFTGAQRDDEIFRICQEIVDRVFPEES